MNLTLERRFLTSRKAGPTSSKTCIVQIFCLATPHLKILVIVKSKLLDKGHLLCLLGTILIQTKLRPRSKAQPNSLLASCFDATPRLRATTTSAKFSQTKEASFTAVSCTIVSATWNCASSLYKKIG